VVAAGGSEVRARRSVARAAAAGSVLAAPRAGAVRGPPRRRALGAGWRPTPV